MHSQSRATTEIHHLSVNQLQIGMYVNQLDIPWEHSSFMFQGFTITSDEDIEALKNECSTVWVDFARFKEYQQDYRKTDNKKSKQTKPPLTVEQEYSEAKSVHNLAHNSVRRMFEEIRIGGQIDSGEIKRTVNSTIESILRNPDANIWLTRLKRQNEQLAQHSMNVATLSIITAQHMNMGAMEIENIGMCAMLHDIGFTSLPVDLINKEGSLSNEERALVQTHTKLGRDILLSTESVYSGAADVAFSHHERPDGMGYPRKLKHFEIPKYAKLISIAEAYDNMSTQQTYKKAKSPSDALQELYINRDTQFDEDLVLQFIESIGIFPPGSVIEMTNGEVGIVLSNTSDQLKPRVILLLDANKDPVTQRVVDLSLVKQDPNWQPYQIKTTLRDGDYGIHVSDFQRAGLRIG